MHINTYSERKLSTKQIELLAEFFMIVSFSPDAARTSGLLFIHLRKTNNKVGDAVPEVIVWRPASCTTDSNPLDGIGWVYGNDAMVAFFEEHNAGFKK